MNPVHEFLAMKEKTAGFLSDLGKAISGSLGPANLGHYFAPAIASAGVAAAGLGVKAGYDAIKDRLTRQRDYKMMLENNPNLRGLDAKHVAAVYNSLRRLSPTMASDPLLAGSFVYKTVSLSPESGLSIDPMTAKTIAETQKSIQQAKSSKTSVYEAMLGGLGKNMPGPQMSFGMSGPQVSGIGSRAIAEQMGLPTDFSSAARQREEQARAEKMMPTYQRPERPEPPLVLGQRSTTTRITPQGETSYETRTQRNIFKKKQP